MGIAAPDKNVSHSEYGLGSIWGDLEKVDHLSRAGFVLQTLSDAVRTMLATPVTAFFSLLSISAALFLLGFFLLVFQNTSSLLQTASSDFRVSVYLNSSIQKEERDALFDTLVARSEVQEVEFWDESKALLEFERSFADFKEIAEGLANNNPLPASFEVTIRPGVSKARYDGLVAEFSELPGVIRVGYEHEIVEQLGGLLGFIKQSGAAAVLLVLIITGFVIASTIRLALYNRQDELAIMRLVGATSWFVRIPCLFEGAFYGLVGGVLGLSFLWIFFAALQHSMLNVSLLLQTAERLEFLSFARALLVLSVGIVVGLTASYLAARRITNE